MPLRERTRRRAICQGSLVVVALPSGRTVRGRIAWLMGKRADVIVWHKRRPYEVGELPAAVVVAGRPATGGGRAMMCSGCRRELDVGDHYIEDTASGFLGREADGLDDLMAEVMGGRSGKIIFCEDCTQDGGDYLFETVYGDEEEGTY